MTVARGRGRDSARPTLSSGGSGRPRLRDQPAASRRRGSRRFRPVRSREYRREGRSAPWRRSSGLPVRSALLGERPGALPGILGGEDRVDDGALLRPSFLLRPLLLLDDDPLAGGDRQTPVIGDPIGKAERQLQYPALFRKVIDESDLAGPFRGEHVTRQGEFHRDL